MENKPDFKILVEQLVLLSNLFDACEDFITDLKKVDSKKAFIKFYHKYHEQIGERLDCIFPDDMEENIVEDLQADIDDLEEELDKYKDNFGELDTLDDIFRAKLFTDYKNKYTIFELEEILQNGKSFLKISA